ncbi:hypothetical protein A6U92_16990 [Agrobacterium rubi]|nr:hypothetical protein A6U92_16990 [Agrobacterium rubi]
MVCVAILGVVLGALAFSSISGGALTFALGLVLYGYLPVRLIKPGFELDPIGDVWQCQLVSLRDFFIEPRACAPITVPFIHAIGFESPRMFLQSR